MSTGFPDADARDDFSRVRRQRVLANLWSRLRRGSDDAEPLLVLEEVTRVLGRTGQRHLGLRMVPIASIVGTVDREQDYDRRFRPTSNRSRERWERIAAAMRRGEALPPIDAYRVGELHFVRDGHHRVSVARALRRDTIDSNVTEILTVEPPPALTRLDDLPLLDHRRIFRERVPLPAGAMARIQLSEPWDYAVLAEGVEAWAFRRSQTAGELLDREGAARKWFAEEFVPVVERLRQAELIGPRTEAEAYLRLSAERYRLVRSHDWSSEIIQRLRRLET